MLKRQISKNTIVNMIVILLFALLTTLLTANRFSESIEYLAEDTLYQRPGSIPNNIKIIAIDEVTMEKLGPFTDWNRSYFTNLIEILNADENERPAVIAIDLILSGTDDSEIDKELVKAADKCHNIVLASKLETVGGSGIGEDGVYYYQNYVESEVTAFDALNQVTESGFTTPIFDKDGFVRRAYGCIESNGNEYISFSMKIAGMYGYTGREGTYEFAYSGKPGEFEIIPMEYVLNGKVPASYFSGSIVLVGAYEEGMMDSFSVPIDRANKMYGVEIQANEVAALLNGKIIHTVPDWAQYIITILVVILIGFFMYSGKMIHSVITTISGTIVYLGMCVVCYMITTYKLDIIYIPIAIILMFLTNLLVRYVRMNKERVEEVQKMLFSMADSLAVAIEGRTPYNANHTRKVAKRSLEMLDYINKQHKLKKTELHFTKNDKKQLYLAAMLHDVGKMDIPTEVMDKPTKLGDKIFSLKDRLNIIKLNLTIDCLEQRTNKEVTDKEIGDIVYFISQLEYYDCGKPLKDEDISFIDDFGKRVYLSKDGEEIPYLTEEEWNDLHIKYGTLSDNEREMMQSHVVFTDNILSEMYFGKEFNRVRRMAADHHELMNGKGYPKQKDAADLDTMTRILTIMDIYDSLIADDRPYKRAKSVEVAFNILDEEAAAGKVDKELLEFAKQLYLNKEN